MSTFDSTGLTVDRKSDIATKLSLAIKSKWGDDWRTDPASQTGQIVEIFSEIFHDQNELILSLSSAFKSKDAFGVWLSELVALNGITRNEATKTVVVVEVTADPARETKIFEGDLVGSSGGGAPFLIDIDVELLAGETKTVSATCSEEGAIEAPQLTINTILTPRLGWSTVSNPSDGIVGSKEETDAELKIRRKRVASAVGTNTTSRLYDELLDIDEIKAVRIYENKGIVTDALGVPPQHIWPIIYGGQDDVIAELMYRVIGAGAGTKGAVAVTHTDTARFTSKEFNWDRGVDVIVDIEIKTKKNNQYQTSNDTLMKEALVLFFADSIQLGGSVARGDLYAPCYTVPNHQVQDVLLAIAGGTLVDADLELTETQRPITTVANITITEVS